MLAMMSKLIEAFEWIRCARNQHLKYCSVIYIRVSIKCGHGNAISHLPLDKMATILADIFNCIFLNENDRIPIKISLKFVPNVPINNLLSVGSDNGLAPNRRQAIIWTNAYPIHWRRYAALEGGELKSTLTKTCGCLSWLFWRKF